MATTLLAAISLVASSITVASAQESAVTTSPTTEQPAQSPEANQAGTANNPAQENSQPSTPAAATTSAAAQPLNNQPAQQLPSGLSIAGDIDADGTADFSANDDAGNDSGPSNGIVRVNDTVTYRVDYAASAIEAENVKLVFTLPKGMEMTELPGFCNAAGSSIDPKTAGEPSLPLKANAIDELNEQTVTCAVGDKNTASYTVKFVAKVLSVVPHNHELKLKKLEVTADNAAPATAANLPTVRASSALMWDVSKNGINDNPNSGYVYGPAQVPCPWDNGRVCFQTGYQVLMSAPTAGKGAMPAIGDITVVDDLTPESMYPQLDAAQLAKFKADLDKYGTRVSLADAFAHQIPGSKIGGDDRGNARTATNSVRDSGTVEVNQAQPGTPATFTFKAPDTTLRTVPTQALRPVGQVLPANRAYAISVPFVTYTPADTIQEFGVKAPNSWTLQTHNQYKNLKVTGLDGTVQGMTDPGQDPKNDYRDTTPKIQIGGAFSKSFTGVPGAARNMTPREFAPNHTARGEGPPGGATINSGGITVAETQSVISQMLLVGSTPAEGTPYSAVMCDSWDNSLLNLQKGDVPASTHASAQFQALPSGGKPVWVSGYNNADLGGNRFGFATDPSQMDAPIKVQYAAAAGGANENSQCGDDKGPWFDDPAQVPGNDAAQAAKGVYTGVGRVRVHTVLPKPKANNSVLGQGVRMAVSINMKVAESGRDAGTKLPNWASAKILANSTASQADNLASQASTWTQADYKPEDHVGAGGDRLILAPLQVRIDKQVRKGTDGAFSDTPPSVSGGDAQSNTPADTVQFQIKPSITSGALTPNILKDVWVEDCLPAAAAFVSADPRPALVSKTVPADAKDGKCAAGETYIRWIFPRHEVNTEAPTILLTTEVQADVKDGSYSNRAFIWGQDDQSPVNLRQNTAPFQVANIAGVKLLKNALTPVVQVNRDGSQNVELNKWQIKLTNTLSATSPRQPQNADIIDILPRQDWPMEGTPKEKSKFTGTFTFDSAELTPTSSKAGQQAKLLYTKAADPKQDPADPTNGANGSTAWCDKPEGGTVVVGTGACPANKSEVTALRMQRPGLFASGDVIEFQVNMLGRNNKGGDVYVNRAFARADGITFPVGPVDRKEESIASAIGDYTWIEANKNGVQDNGEKPIANVEVRLTGKDDLDNAVDLTTRTNADGKYLFEGLRASNAQGYVVTFGLPAGYERTKALQGADRATDSNADPANGVSPAVVLGQNTKDLTVDAGYVVKRQPLKVVKVVNANGSTGNETFHLNYECTADGTNEDGSQPVPKTGKVEVNSADPAPKTIGFFESGTKCKITTEDKADRAGYTLKFEAGQEQTIETDGATLRATNTYTRNNGGFTVAKKVVVDGKPETSDATYKVGYTCKATPAITGELTLKADGTPVKVGNIPTGTECELTEIGGERDGYAKTAQFDKKTFTVAKKDETVAVTLTNTYTRNQGVFKVTKKVVGADGKEAGKKFHVNYSCVDPKAAAGQGPITGALEVEAGKEVTSPKLPEGSSCTLSEDLQHADSKIPSYTLDSAVFDPNTPVVITKDPAVVTVNLTNTYTRDTGSFTVAKKVVVDGKPEVSPTPFKVRYTCNATPAITGELTITSDQAALARVDNIPTGTECQLAEVDGDRDGYTKAAKFDKQTFTVDKKGEAIAVTLTNTYTRNLGVFKVTKKVVGADGKEAGKQFRVNYSCVDPKVANGQGPITGFLEVEAGKEVTSPKLPEGSTCTLNEDLQLPNHQITGYTLDKAVFEPSTPLVIGKEPAVVSATLTNTYSRDLGSFTVAKKVVVDGKTETSDAAFKVGYTCNATPAIAGELTVKADGTPVKVENIPTGTECELKELDGDRPGYTKVAQFDKQRFTVTTKGETIAATLTNTYTRDLGGLNISKKVTGNAVALVPKTFKFDYQCVGADAAKTPTNGTVEVKAGETSTIPNLPTGSCTITEQNAQVNNTTLATSYEVDGKPVTSTEVKVNVALNSTVKVTATNDYTTKVGKFAVRKKVTADMQPELVKDKEFAFSYTCKPAYEGAFAPVDQVLKVKADGTVQSVDLPIGTTCTVTEQDAAVAGFDWIAPMPQTIKVESDTKVAELAFENVYKRQTAQFGIAKTVRVWMPFATNTFQFNYECVDPTQNKIAGVLAVPGNGQQVVAPEKLPIGTKCTITEDKQDAYRVTFLHFAPDDITFTVGADDVNKVIGFSQVNTYIPIIPFIIPLIGLIVVPVVKYFNQPRVQQQVKQEPTVQQKMVEKGIPKTYTQQQPNNKTATKGKGLANTGVSDMIPLLGLLGLLLIVAGAVLAKRRCN
ncbi:MAG: DUF5979 domain-containing protein [Corynebacterium sp.]|nr:DUF5979 domain-containing protein [Corynebacterium sp.]